MNEVVDHHCLSFFDNFLLIYTIKDNITQSIRDWKLIRFLVISQPFFLNSLIIYNMFLYVLYACSEWSLYYVNLLH